MCYLFAHLKNTLKVAQCVIFCVNCMADFQEKIYTSDKNGFHHFGSNKIYRSFNVKLMHPSGLCGQASGIPRHGNIQNKAECKIIDQHGGTAETDERQRYTGDRKKAYGHTHILDIVESKIRGKAGKSIGCGF